MVTPKDEFEDLPVIEARESEEITVAGNPHYLRDGDATDPVQHPHVENVRLIKRSKSHGGATGFNSDIPLFLSIGLVGLCLLGYFLLR